MKLKSSSLFWLITELALFLRIAEGQGFFQFGTISWKRCDAGFFDPLFPLVCQNPSTDPARISVGVKINVAFPSAAGIPSQNSLLQDIAADTFNFARKISRVLRISRKSTSPALTRQIAYRTISAANVVQTVSFNCTADPCQDQYDFQIDRIDSDLAAGSDMVYAHFTVEARLNSGQNYAFFFEGCCRPPTYSSNSPTTLSIINNPGLPFHIRAEVLVSSNTAAPTSSISFVMPDQIILPINGPAGPSSCAPLACSADCTLTFQLQAFHTDSRFRDRVRFRYATDYEAGLYYCAPGGAGSALVTSRCSTSPAYTRPSGLSSSVGGTPTFSPATMDSAGNVKFPVGSAGAWQATFVAYCDGCGAGRGNLTVDLLVKVIDNSDNPNPPRRTYNPDPQTPQRIQGQLVNNGISGVSPASSPSAPYVVECGLRWFALPSTAAAGPPLPFLRVGYKDPDDRTTQCSNTPQSLAFILPVNDFPTGVNLTDLRNEVDGADPNGASYLDVYWTPQCEDTSQIGLFALCFAALDNANLVPGGTFRPLPPAPSPDNCAFVLVLPPPEVNPSPVLVSPPTPVTACSGDCCPCCGQPVCPCQDAAGAAGGVGCCTSLLGVVGVAKAFTVLAQDSNPGREVRLSVTTATSSPSSVTGIPDPIVLGPKYGCSSTGAFADCVSQPSVTARPSVQVYWNLTTIAGLSSQRGAPPILVCYQAHQVVPPQVDQAKWLKVYGRPPNNDSCTVCLTLTVKAPPFFVDAGGPSGLPWASPPDGATLSAGFGRSVVFNVTAASSDLSQVVKVVLLADPGAPNGLFVSPPINILVSTLSLLVTVRTVTFSPALDQLGSVFPVCFQSLDTAVDKTGSAEEQARAKQNSRSLKRCFTIRAPPAVVSWAGTSPCPTDAAAAAWAPAAGPAAACRPYGARTVTVGCRYAFTLAAAAPGYQLSIREQQAPLECEGCLAGGRLSVPLCPAAAFPGGPCCGDGRCEGPETAGSCPRDCEADLDFSLSDSAAGADGVSRAEVVWRVGRELSGRVALRCFEAADALGGTAVTAKGVTELTSPTFCVAFRVSRCRFCAPAGATLESMSQMYDLQVSWLRLYNSNVRLRSPDELPDSDSFPSDPDAGAIVAGPNYLVQPGDSIHSIAIMAKSTVKSVLALNADVVGPENLQVGAELCLLLCSASPSSTVAAAAAMPQTVLRR